MSQMHTAVQVSLMLTAMQASLMLTAVQVSLMRTVVQAKLTRTAVQTSLMYTAAQVSLMRTALLLICESQRLTSWATFCFWAQGTHLTGSTGLSSVGPEKQRASHQQCPKTISKGLTADQPLSSLAR